MRQSLEGGMVITNLQCVDLKFIYDYLYFLFVKELLDGAESDRYNGSGIQQAI